MLIKIYKNTNISNISRPAVKGLVTLVSRDLTCIYPDNIIFDGDCNAHRGVNQLANIIQYIHTFCADINNSPQFDPKSS